MQNRAAQSDRWQVHTMGEQPIVTGESLEAAGASLSSGPSHTWMWTPTPNSSASAAAAFQRLCSQVNAAWMPTYPRHRGEEASVLVQTAAGPPDHADR